MPVAEATASAGQMLVVCNACRYCEQFCPVFPALERRTSFPRADLHYLANLCHNCGECLYACQYAPPHPFGVSLPGALARVRGDSYEHYCWPRPLAAAFRHQGGWVAILLVGLFTLLLLLGRWLVSPAGPRPAQQPGDFYAVIPHQVMVGVFGLASLAAGTVLAVSLASYWRAIRGPSPPPVSPAAWATAFRDGVVLRHLHGGGVDCASALDDRGPWRRWQHHATLAGFALCLASTIVAAVYHSAFGWTAPHDYLSLPVVLGVAGGVGLVAGPVGLLVNRGHRDPALADPSHRGMDTALLVLLLVTSVTGLALLSLRHTSAMSPLLFVHLGAVLAFFVTVPYSKFVHGFYRLLSLAQSEAESRAD